jgi:pre-60S factor REI1
MLCSVANIKRRVSSLPPITQEDHEAQKVSSVAKTAKVRPESSSSEDEEEEEPEHGHDESQDENVGYLNPMRCLFCHEISSSIEDNISHMEISHGFRIPEIDALQEGLEPLLWYLDLVVNQFFSCLFCSRSKQSSEAIRSHMFDRGHCMLDLSPGSEYLVFWEALRESEDGAEANIQVEDGNEASTRMLSTNEMALHSGRVIMSRNSDVRAQRQRKRSPNKDDTSLITVQRDATAQPGSAEHPVAKKIQLLSPRDRMGIVGLSNAEQRVILAAQKRQRTRQSKDASARRWTLEKIANKQKKFKVTTGLPSFPTAS